MKLNLKNNLLLLLMVLSSAVATKFTPSSSLADELPKIYLKTMVPSEFGDWKEVLNTSTQIIDPQQKKTIEEIYSETFSKTYTNQVGYRIMLSIAYGKNQRDSLQLHKPEVCYPAQGFTLLSQSKDEISNLGESKKKIPITRLTTSLGQRKEPITYWITVGNNVVQGQLNKKIVEMHYALNGRIPDGMLVRISSVDKETERAFFMQDQFTSAMINSIDPTTQERFIGSGERK